MTSKERILAAVSREPVDYVPCSPHFNPLSLQARGGRKWDFPWSETAGQREIIAYCINVLGIDPHVRVQGISYHPDPSISSRVWKEGSVLHEEWNTPSGAIHAAVKVDAQWPHGEHIPFHSDFNVSHYVEPWLQNEQDLACLRHIMRPPETKGEIEKIRERFRKSKALADEFQLPLLVVQGAGLTGAQQIAGAEGVCMLAIEQPDVLDAYLELEHQWNLRGMALATESGADIIHRNGFYETCDFYSPAMLEKFLARRLTEEADLVHDAGKRITYTINSGIMPMLDYLDAIPVDCIFGLDVASKGIDLQAVAGALAGKKSFWTGASSGYHMYGNDPEVVREDVRTVIRTFGKRGLILTAAFSIHSIMPWENTLAMIDEWKKLR